MHSDTINDWIERFAADDDDAATPIVDAYYDRLVRFARSRLKGLPPQVADDEGAVVSAFRSFFSGVRGRQYDRLENREDLWRVLATITARKAIAQYRRHWKQSGERDRVQHLPDFERMTSSQPTPEEVAAFLDDCRARVEGLGNETLQRIALLKLEGHATGEIAERLGVHVRSVQRKLKLIETQWMQDGGTDNDGP
jgi:DNA-directed RNA polymerase specialized sigma24 family protein